MSSIKVAKFYDDGGGEELINTDNYPVEINNFLIAEEKVILDLLRSNNTYDTLFEIGCMQARNATIAVAANVKYAGIDIVPRYIQAANDSFNLNNQLKKIATVKLLSIYDLNKTTTPVGVSLKTLAIFPFNSFGNMDNPNLIITNLINLNYDFVIFTYDTDLFTNTVRRNYYKNCNYTKLQYVEELVGIRFIANEGLNTIAYHADYLKNLVPADANYTVKVEKFSTIGQFVYAYKT